MTAVLARLERFDRVGSTNDVVRDWLAEGTPEVCLAVASEQTDGRGRQGRAWVGPPGQALLLSVGFRPTWVDPAGVWRLAATVSMAMAEAAEAMAGLPAGSIRLKWPNDLVVEVAGRPDAPGAVRKLAGVLGETAGLGTLDPSAVVGIGINTDWSASDFPADLKSSMTSLREVGGRPVDGAALLDRFIERLGARIDDLRESGRFDAVAWADRQVTTGRMIRLERPDGALSALAVGVDPTTGALIIREPGPSGLDRSVVVGEVSHLRFVDPVAAGV